MINPRMCVFCIHVLKSSTTTVIAHHFPNHRQNIRVALCIVSNMNGVEYLQSMLRTYTRKWGGGWKYRQSGPRMHRSRSESKHTVTASLRIQTANCVLVSSSLHILIHFASKELVVLTFSMMRTENLGVLVHLGRS
jgi:hypothetical protein